MYNQLTNKRFDDSNYQFLILNLRNTEGGTFARGKNDRFFKFPYFILFFLFLWF